MRVDSDDIAEALFSAVGREGASIGDAGTAKPREVARFRNQLAKFCAELPPDLMIAELSELLEDAQ